MRWYVDINSIGSSAPTQRYCVEAEQWQKALMSVRDQRGDHAPFGNFSIELLDDGYRAIDPGTRTRYVVQRAPDDAPVTSEPTLLASEGKSPATKTPEARASRPRASSRGRVRGKSPSIPDDPVPIKAAPEAAAAKPSAPVAPAAPPSEPASPPTASPPPTSQSVFTAPTVKAPTPSTPPRAASQPPQAPGQPPLVAPRPMQAETAFERMTGGAAVPLPDSVSPTADVPTEVLPSFSVLTKRSEDPTPSSPLTYREMAVAVASSTSLKEAEAIARAQFEVLRNALSGAPKGKFIQLAVFDHEFSGRPQRAPLVTLAYRDWRNPEPELRFPLRDGAGASVPPPSAAASPPSAAPPPPSAAASPPSAAPPPPSAAASPPSAAPPPPSAAAPAPSAAPPPPSAAPPAQPAAETAAGAPPAAPSSPDMFSDKTAVTTLEAVPPSATSQAAEDLEPIRPAPVISIGDDSIGPAPEVAPALAEAAQEAAPSALALAAAPEPVAASAAAEQAAAPTEAAAVAAAPSAAPAPIPAPTPSEIRRSAADMAGEDERTWVKPSTPEASAASAPHPASAPPPPPQRPASAPPAQGRPASVPPPPPQRRPGSIPPPNGTQPMMQLPPPAHLSAPPPPEPRPASVPPAPEARPASIPPAPALSAPPPASMQPPVSVAPAARPVGTGITTKASAPPRKAGDDLLTDLFEATADLSFVRDPLEGAEFVQDLVYESIPSAVVLVSFFDINTREFVVVRQARDREEIGGAVLRRASELTGAIAQAMRSGRTVILNGNGAAALTGDARWRATGLTPRSVAVTPVAAGGRYLGLIEVADPLDGAPYSEGDGHALTYIGEQLGEFLAQRELVLDEASVLKPKLAQLARRP